jgi:hypothetical protein
VKGEVLAEIAGFLVDLAFGLRLAALVVARRLVERAVETAMEIGAAPDAGVTTPDVLRGTDILPTVMTYSLRIHGVFGVFLAAGCRG